MVLIIFAGFSFIEALLWVGVIPPENDGSLSNLAYGLDKVLENPAFWGVLLTIMVSVGSGFMENWTMTKETFSLNKFGETFFFYEPLMLLFGQILPVQHAAVFLFAVDVLRRIAKRIAAEPSVAALAATAKS